MNMDDREKILELYKDLRVADVRDGMDWNMMHHYGSVHYEIRPLFRTRVVGIPVQPDMSLMKKPCPA